MTTRVAIVGASGKLGTIVRAVIAAEPGYEEHALLGSRSALSELDGADLVVDVSTPASSVDVVRAAVERGIPILVGTSGWSAERIALVRPLVAASGSPAVFIPNFSLGSVIGSALAAAAAPFFSSIEIVETHPNTKIDSPSGTAVRTAELMADARSEAGPVEAPHGDQRARGQQVASIPIHSLRLQGVAARQQVVFGAPGETLTIAHDTTTPAAAYAPGISLAMRETVRASGVVVGLDSFIDIGLRVGAPGPGPDIDDGAAPGGQASGTFSA
ncbi:MAG TPA: 4-hydroxy-tetrahydrodipicolinate reductase [Microbacteriaceae bacterium]|jgi:4-hydroxy-tetrahydrodipicolinate reductase|nr:4-hydroxy-tetrahydrodipicolinate reductase [Microbacteriaceae bacterium]HQX35531.1 4-hydroxy-tetrahydrodipicolinate reductase [Microbacteriaceae bacterium]HQZ48261.1 4-hydroxy-tetrahydrodipicolinate reductase [Microbacteriaceae bacterium]HRA09338.1 4-hydroxy-tetrahydrodipicolinate reductase [Microbacteriaceae bacterium]